MWNKIKKRYCKIQEEEWSPKHQRLKTLFNGILMLVASAVTWGGGLVIFSLLYLSDNTASPVDPAQYYLIGGGIVAGILFMVHAIMLLQLRYHASRTFYPLWLALAVLAVLAMSAGAEASNSVWIVVATFLFTFYRFKQAKKRGL